MNIEHFLCLLSGGIVLTGIETKKKKPEFILDSVDYLINTLFFFFFISVSLLTESMFPAYPSFVIL
ncbi:MAG: hypothetical protein D3903_14195 [Candidatus Electrothrix sp. GM3_4]|nr:hypothetical protein [Candidatus Electrothrix sp. GM3_4]